MEDSTHIDENEKSLPVCVRMNVYCDIDGIRDSVFNNIQDALEDYDLSEEEWNKMLEFIQDEWQGDFRISLPVIVEKDDDGGIEVSLNSGNWAGKVFNYD